MAIEDDKDDIGADIRAAMEGTLTNEPPAPAPELDAPAPADETAEQKADRVRDEAGRFAKGEAKPRETLTLKPVATPKPGAASLAAEAPKAAETSRIPPPKGWNGTANINWERLPQPVKEAFAKDYAQLEQDRAEITPIRELIDANRQFLVNEAGSVVEAQRQMMAFARMSVDDPRGLIQHIARAKGVDLAALVGQPQQQASGQQPQDLASYVDRLVQQKLQPLAAQFQQQSQQQTETTISQIRAFSEDPAHPYFNDVAQTIERLLQAGEIPEGPPLQRLQQAYDHATWGNPAIRSQLMAAQGEEAGQRKAADVAKAQAAQRASLTGSPVPGGSSLNGSGNPNASIRDDLISAFRAQQGV